MVVLRATRKVLRYLPEAAEPDGESHTALGDWYVNRIMIGRTPLLVLISSRSFLPMLIRAQDVRSLPERLPELVRGRLRRLGGVSADLIEAEVAAMEPVAVAKTDDRSVLGILVDTSGAVPYHVGPDWMDETALHFGESRLQRTPWNVTQKGKEVVFPEDKTAELLRARWGGG